MASAWGKSWGFAWGNSWGSIEQNLADTHDGWWAKQWKKKKPPQTVEEVQEVVERVIAKAKTKPIPVPVPDRTEQIELAQRLIGRIQQIQDDEEEAEILLLL